MIIQFHTPKGIVEVDSETVTDKELLELNVSRVELNKLVSRDAFAEIDELRVRINKHEGLQ